MAGHPRPTGEDCDLTKIGRVHHRMVLVCPAAAFLSSRFPFLLLLTKLSGQRSRTPIRFYLSARESAVPKLTQLSSAASYVAFKNNNAFNPIHPVDCFPECLQAYSNITGKRSMSLSSPEFPIDMSGRRCSGRITSQFVKT